MSSTTVRSLPRISRSSSSDSLSIISTHSFGTSNPPCRFIGSIAAHSTTTPQTNTVLGWPKSLALVPNRLRAVDYCLNE